MRSLYIRNRLAYTSAMEFLGESASLSFRTSPRTPIENAGRFQFAASVSNPSNLSHPRWT
jgi:hypothetical protein